MVRTSYLRVYEPLSSFSPTERSRWIKDPAQGARVDAHAARRWLIASSLPEVAAPFEPSEGAFVREVDGVVLVCPWRTRLRMLAGLLAFRGSVPDEIADAFVPEEEARRAATELHAAQEQDPNVRSYILHANWHVPLRWFSAFSASERILTEDADGLHVRYETRVHTGRARMKRALEILESSWIDEAVIEALKELSQWLDQFDANGLVELDYGSVARSFSDDELVEDRSAAEVWTCLQALDEGDVVRAGRVFAALTEAWAGLRAHEVVN
jgi:hypothetical protein